MMNMSGPRRPSTGTGPGSGVASNLRLAEYSLSLPFAIPNSMKLFAGASGYSFKEWKGSFYPENIKPDAMLAWYGERLPSVEINNTFYQMPKVSVLENWAKSTPEGHGAAFEFRNASWFADEVYDALKAAGAALCLSEREDNAPPPLVQTASWGYVRLRLETYSDGDLQQWADRLAATAWREIYVYFMHEPTAPAYAQTLMRHAR